MEKRIVKIILTIILLAGAVFVFQPQSASAIIIQDLKIPPQAGTIKEVFSNPVNPEKVIIQIQDAHCNYEAQKKLAGILEYLIKQQKIKLVMVEGGSGDVGLSFLRGYSDKKNREAVAEKYLKLGQISGEEYLDIVSDYDFELYGVEDEDLYNSNLDAFMNSDSARQEGLKGLSALSSTVEKLKGAIYGPALKEFEAKKGQFEDKKLNLSEYAAFLKDKALSCGLRSEASQLSSFVDSVTLEKQLNFKQAEKERNDCIKQFGSLLDEAAVRKLLTRTREFTAGTVTPQDFYVYLKDLAVSKGLDLPTAYPSLSSYITYLTMSKKVDAQELVKEMGSLEQKIRQGLCVTRDEKQLVAIDTRLRLATGFLKLELTPDEYAAFAADKDTQLSASWIPFLTEACAKNGISDAPQASAALDNNIEQLESFYRLGLAREQSFIKNMAQKMKTSGNSSAVLITGGFHTDGLNRLLKNAGYSYVVVTPAISQKADPELYFSVLRSEQARLADNDTSDDSD